MDDTMPPDHVIWCNNKAEEFNTIHQEICNNSSINHLQIEEYVKQCEQIRDSIATMRGTIPSPPVDEIEEALAKLGLARCAELTLITIEKQYRVLAKRYHPDLLENSKTPELKAENDKRLTEINVAMDCLRRNASKLVDEML
jgi:hypothetical protein